jgi:integrase
VALGDLLGPLSFHHSATIKACALPPSAGPAIGWDRAAFSSITLDVRAIRWFARYLLLRCPDAVDERAVTRELLEGLPWRGWPAAAWRPTPATPTSCACGCSSTPVVDTAGCRAWRPPPPSTATSCPAGPAGPTTSRVSSPSSARRRRAKRSSVDRPGVPAAGPQRRATPLLRVMAQLERPEKLAQLPDTTSRHLVVVLMETGLRANDACVPPFNPIIDDSVGWPCLRYYNAKMSAEQLVPLSARAAEAIRPSRSTFARPLAPRACSRPPPGTPTDCGPFKLRDAAPAARSLAGGDRRPRRGRPCLSGDGPPVPPHLSRRLINKGVPQHVIQRLLGARQP